MKCVSCKRVISKKTDANILTFLYFRLSPFCNKCYMRLEKEGYKRHFLYFPAHPMNSKIRLVGLIFSTLIFGWLLFYRVDYELLTTGLRIFLGFVIALLFWEWTLYFRAKWLVRALK